MQAVVYKTNTEPNPNPNPSLGFELLIQIRRSFNDSDDVVPFREESHPVVEDALLFVVKVLPLGLNVLGFGGCLG